MGQPKPCKVLGCGGKKDLPSHFCYWHRIERLPIDEQIEYAIARRALTLKTKPERSRVPQEQWPAKRRWCSGCQFMVPMWYVQGTRCKACESHADYSRHLRVTYQITYDFYLTLWKFQAGRCYICRRAPKTRRLAVDHDHKTGEVRGLLCSGERSCNHDILGNISSIDMAHRIVLYLEDPPARALKEGRLLPDEVTTAGGGVLNGRSRVIQSDTSTGGTVEVMQRMVDQSIEARARRAVAGHYSDGDFWRFPDGTEMFDIFHAVPDKLDPKIWAKRIELAEQKRDEVQAQRSRTQD